MTIVIQSPIRMARIFAHPTDTTSDSLLTAVKFPSRPGWTFAGPDDVAPISGTWRAVLAA